MPRGGGLVRNARHCARALQRNPGGHNVSVCNSAPMACTANRESFWTINDTTAGGAYVDIAGDTGLDEGVA